MRLELTRRADYAIRAMLVLVRAGEARTSASRIAALADVPVRFVPHVMTDLARAGYVSALLGRGGGYVLTDVGRSVSVLDVVEAVEGDTRRRTCVLRGGPCRPDGPCDVHHVFAEAQDALRSRLSAAAIVEIAKRPE